MQISERIEAMVERYNDDIVFTGQIAALVIGVSTTADEEAATMQPDHAAALAAVVNMRPPYLQHQTVFANRQVGKVPDCFHFAAHFGGRISDEGRVGKACVSTDRS